MLAKKHEISTVPRGSRAKLCPLIDVETPRYLFAKGIYLLRGMLTGDA